ncbi:Flp family type IVb pilin [Pseudomonas chlororaphis]|uniref:Flp family type IVb pilin n=1 Tax=Pseudomonas chlororaphis TaxID=587753 RepID=UPI00026E46B8|nr:Flp family type IVb pilin [Pseudomonas chlororaphis]EJL07520.1 type IVb pilin Flp [Pseudomonas chlororaphis subsp. aureofaciens 30-84]WDG55520.1 Flp family type IVb pilin [Pseudomonas chlororaphis]WDH36094.1 Flp family type IVb pilin [Pseudomonas chlororaphis]WDH42179.1 Flp family type IVb pilin [Pseudomonas chlororaphis]WDH89279.1 Flp family type IVb pilin [Pseudomonas chlororaphis]
MFFILATQWITLQASRLLRFLKNNEGASGIEYALIAGMVAVAISAFVPEISNAITGTFETLQAALENDTTTAAPAAPSGG